VDHSNCSYGLLADSPFTSQAELQPLSRQHSKQQAHSVQASLLAAIPDQEEAALAAAAADIEKGLAELEETGSCSSKLQQLGQQLLQLFTWQGLKRAGSSVAAGVRHWWQQQPKKQLLVVLASFIVYAVVSGMLATMPKCGAGQYTVLGAFLLFTVAVTFVTTRLQWRAAAATAAAAAAADDGQQLELQQLPEKVAANSAATTPDTVKDVDIKLVLDHLQSCPKQQQQQQGSTAGTALVEKQIPTADPSDFKAVNEDDN
jgi:hypothetical protein